MTPGGPAACPLGKVAAILGHETVEETVWLLGVGVESAGWAAGVLDDPHVPVRVILDALVTTATKYA